MIEHTIEFFQDTQHFVDFVCYLIIFMSSFYVAIHARNVPNWLITSVWYIGVMAFLSLTTIIIELFFGPEHPLSNKNLGTLTETMLLVVLAVTMGTKLYCTIIADIKGSKSRKK